MQTKLTDNRTHGAIDVSCKCVGDSPSDDINDILVCLIFLPFLCFFLLFLLLMAAFHLR